MSERPGRAALAVDGLLEASVAGSFSRIGYLARRRLFGFEPLLPDALAGRTAVVTGATSGIGLATAELLARAGARVVLVGRDAKRAEAARARIATYARTPPAVLLADLSLIAEAGRLAGELGTRHDRIDVLVHAAGALLHERTVTTEGYETTVATHVLAPFFLTSLLLPRLEQAAPGRVVFVASGGMYSERLDGDLLLRAEPYDGVKQYARAKRAQVALAAEWTRRLGSRAVSVHAMHPGWVDTPGLAGALPRFRMLLRPVLRRPPEGADTIAWLAGGPSVDQPGGRLWLDRRQRSPHRLKRTRRPDEAAEAARLFRRCEELTGADV